MLNNVVLVGRLVKSPVYYKKGDVTKFRIAVDKQLEKSVKERFEKEGKETADFINITAFNGLGHAVAKHLNKGSQVAVTGELRSYYEEGKGLSLSVLANNVRFLD